MGRMVDMTGGRPTKQMLVFAVPLIAGNVGQQLYMVADAVIVGRGVGVEALAAVGATDWTYWLILWIVQAFTQGFAARISHYIGAADEIHIKKSISMSVVLCCVLGVSLTVLSLLIAAPMLRLLDTPDNIFNYSISYLRTLFAGTVIVTAYNMASAILRAFGDGKTPLIGIAIAAVTNIGLDCLFVFAFHWGIIGAGVATVIAQMFAFLYCLFHLLKLPLKIERKYLKPDFKVIKVLCSLGVSMALQQAFIAVSGMVLQFAINLHGFIYVAGFTATNKLYGLLESSSLAFGYAVTTYMAQNYGAKRYDRIRKGMKSILLISFILALFISVVMLIFGKSILSLFISSTDENAATVMEVAYHYLSIMSFTLPTLYLLNGFRSTLQGLGQGLAVMFSGIVESLGRISIALFLSKIWSELIFFSEPGTWIITNIYLIVVCTIVLKKVTKPVKQAGDVPSFAGKSRETR